MHVSRQGLFRRWITLLPSQGALWIIILNDTYLWYRSAISNAAKMLETQNLIHRLRLAGTRADLISLAR